MISFDVKIKESLDRDNLSLCKAIIMACTCFECWVVTSYAATGNSGYALVLWDYKFRGS
jgi:hypothetical protein